MGRVIAYARAVRQKFGVVTGRRFAFAVIADPLFFRSWLAYLDKGLSPKPSGAMKLELALRPVRSYLRRHLGPRAKARIARHHYGTLDARLRPESVYALRATDGLTLARFFGKSGREYCLSLKGLPGPEGEVTFQILDVAQNAHLAWLTGSFGPDRRGRTIFWIGTLQGPRPPRGRDDIVMATRDLNGLRPKHAVLHGACAVCSWLGVETLSAPSGANHVTQTLARRVFGRRPKIHTDLDSFWQEFTSERTALGDYRISTSLKRRHESEVASKRRKEWRLRHQKVDSISAQVAQSLARSVQTIHRGRDIADLPGTIARARSSHFLTMHRQPVRWLKALLAADI